MQKSVVFRLSILLTAQVFLAGILAMPGWNYAINLASGHIVSDDFKKSTTSTSSHAVVVTETVTTVETVIVGTVTVPDTLDSSSVITTTSDIATDDQLET
ncbi:hypothetical protein NUW58_g2987 [Xylaria curta]|uniref:Uncharacterized protein n=1 Tax=Xylaria curta TaxID=42375 RepID=A0ACC1PG45_9PEZI|nr:hypothetical protein NUW58_g2987 [Xylaria curta]